MKNTTKPIIRLVIKEELVLLTGDYISALVLNQFIYWSERVKDFDKFLAEKVARKNLDAYGGNVSLRNGWIYKSAEEMAGELLRIASDKTIQRRMKELVEKGFLNARSNSDNNWDKTLQYRVDIATLQRELQSLGYALEDSLFSDDQSRGQIDQSKRRCDSSKEHSGYPKSHCVQAIDYYRYY